MNANTAENFVFQDLEPSDSKAGDVVPFMSDMVWLELPNTQSLNWTTRLEERFAELLTLPFGWDGYHGQPVRLECARFAAALLQKYWSRWVGPPELVPGSDGTIQLEWHEHGYDVEIDVLGPYKVIASRFDHDIQEHSGEFELQADFSIISDWIGDLESRAIGVLDH